MRWSTNLSRRPVLAVLLAAALVVAGLLVPAAGAPAQAAPRIVHTYDVRGMGNTTSLEEFAARAAQTYADARGWGLWGQIEFRRVASGGSFTLWLSAPQLLPTFSSGCSTQWSCRVGRNVVINELRFRGASPAWLGAGASLRDYQHLVVNHETGHWLGFGHRSCPAAGAPAPVMQQQSKNLGGCRPNAWPTAGEQVALARAKGVSPTPPTPPPPPGPPQVPAGSVVTIPVGAEAVAAKAVGVNLTVAAPAADGWAVAYPCGQPQPPTSTLNYPSGGTVAGFAVVGVGAGGAICVVASATAHLVVDLSSALPAASTYQPAPPVRLLDTRATGRPATGPVAVGLPAGAGAAALTVTSTQQSGAGHLTVHPCGEPLPLASSVNFKPGRDAANLVLAKAGADGRVCIAPSTPTGIVVDLAGTWPAGSGFAASTPARLLDTRLSGSRVSGVVAVPLPGGAAHALNLTVTDPQAGGWVGAYPCGTAWPGTSSINFTAGQTVANAVVAAAGADGRLCLLTSGQVNLIVDDSGAFGPGELLPVTPRRLLDTRAG
jgi:hypothetical protein